MKLGFSTADLALARRLEEAEAANAFHIGRASPGGKVEVEPICDGCAMFAGVGSPLTHAMGIGMAGEVSDEDFDRLEEFFRERGSPSMIDLCPMADATVLQHVTERGYKVLEFNNLMLHRVAPADTAWVCPEEVEITPVEEGEPREWCELLVRGFNHGAEPSAEMVEMVMSLPSGGQSFFAHVIGDAVGTAGMSMHGRVALLFADSTLPEARGRGVQQALIRERLKMAAQGGCEWAMACVLPGSGSHRNYERCGFDLFYMRVNLILDL
ncbi:MAG TPA: GNAT family N-acetyltransferase [Paludibaculum sp.]|jgi:GNAT superfamily N-acetyltransferase